MKFLMKQYTANSVASFSPSSGLILGSATGGEAASAGGPRTSGAAALMTPDAGQPPRITHWRDQRLHRRHPRLPCVSATRA
ncbi:unnamed protein product, partial [Brenthis ino]